MDLTQKIVWATVLVGWVLLVVPMLVCEAKIHRLALRANAYGRFAWRRRLLTVINTKDPRCPDWLRKDYSLFRALSMAVAFLFVAAAVFIVFAWKHM